MKALDLRTAVVLVLVFALGFAAATFLPRADAAPASAAAAGEVHGVGGKEAQFLTSADRLVVVRDNLVYVIDLNRERHGGVTRAYDLK